MALGLGITTELLEKPILWTPKEQGLGQYLEIWLEGGVDMTSAGWLDQSGQGNDARQTISGSQPDVNLAHPPNLRFDGFNDYMDFTSRLLISQNEPFSICIAFKPESVLTRAFLSDAASEFMEMMTAKKFRFKGNVGGGLASTLQFDNVIFTNGAFHAMIFARDASNNLHLHINSSTGIEPNASSTNTQNDRGFDIFNLGTRNDSDKFFYGDMYEVFVYNKFLTEPERKNAISYLKHKFS